MSAFLYPDKKYFLFSASCSHHERGFTKNDVVTESNTYT